ncbi:multicopper oxidase domain-containing protein, partial [Geobacillus stearothermophilus]|uniref:multicopper oxidase domain-containing protein n=1 Tax=Geobacillus stearothermophilus TaxID=1422 RepID=UPI002E202EC4
MKRNVSTLLSVALVASRLAACSNGGGGEAKAENKNGTAATTQQSAANMLAAHKGLNQAPVPLKMERVGLHDVRVEMTAQITDIEIDKGKIYKAWTFNGQAPGPLVVVNEGDTIHLTSKNSDPDVPHCMDNHAVI